MQMSEAVTSLGLEKGSTLHSSLSFGLFRVLLVDFRAIFTGLGH